MAGRIINGTPASTTTTTTNGGDNPYATNTSVTPPDAGSIDTKIPIDKGLELTKDIRKGLDVGKDRTVAYSEVDVSGTKENVIGVSG